MNNVIARNPSELALYESMDRARRQKDLEEHLASGKTGMLACIHCCAQHRVSDAFALTATSTASFRFPDSCRSAAAAADHGRGASGLAEESGSGQGGGRATHPPPHAQRGRVRRRPLGESVAPDGRGRRAHPAASQAEGISSSCGHAFARAS